MLIPFSLLIVQCMLLGSMVFFAAVVAPSVFKFVPEKEAGNFLRGLFPRYYLWGMLLSLAMSVLAAMTSSILLASSLLVLLLFVIARQFLMPAINRSRDLAKQGDEAAKQRFSRLHGASVLINLAQMLVLLGVTVYLVNT